MSSYKKPMKLNIQQNSKSFSSGKNQPFQRPERKVPELLKKQQTASNTEQSTATNKNEDSLN